MVSTMRCCLLLGIVNDRVILLLLLPGYRKCIVSSSPDDYIDSRGTLLYQQRTQMVDKSGDGASGAMDRRFDSNSDDVAVDGGGYCSHGAENDGFIACSSPTG